MGLKLFTTFLPGRPGRAPAAPRRPGGRRAGLAGLRVTMAAGTVRSLLPFLWGRRPFTDARYAVTGDADLLGHWRRHAVIN